MGNHVYNYIFVEGDYPSLGVFGRSVETYFKNGDYWDYERFLEHLGVEVPDLPTIYDIWQIETKTDSVGFGALTKNWSLLYSVSKISSAYPEFTFICWAVDALLDERHFYIFKAGEVVYGRKMNASCWHEVDHEEDDL